MAKRKKKGSAAAAQGAADGASPELVQKTLFDKMSESQLLVFLQQLIVGLVERVASLERMLVECLNRIMGGTPFTAKEYYTPKEFGKIVGLKVETVREHLKNDRLDGTQTISGRGGIPEWRISHDELKRFWKEGLREMRPEDRYRHYK